MSDTPRVDVVFGNWLLGKISASELHQSMRQFEKEHVELEMRFGFTYCAYCGHRFEIDAPTPTEEVEKHINTCEKHPVYQLRKKLSEAESKIELLETKLRGRVNDDQKYLVEPLCSAETQVDELRAELAKKDGQIEAILKERDVAIDRLDADRQQAEIDLRRKFAETIAFLIEEQYQNITSEYERGFHNGLYGAFGAITGKDHWTGFQTKQVKNQLIEQIQITLEETERNFVELDRAMSANLPGLAKAAYGCGLKSLRDAIKAAKGEA